MTNHTESENRQNPGNSFKKLSVRQIFFYGVTLLGLLYLFSVSFGAIKKDRLGQTEAVIFVTILLLNSEFIERLGKFKFGELSLELEQKVAEVKEKQTEIQDVQKQHSREIEEIVNLLANSFLEKNEFWQLQRLAGEQPFNYKNKNTNVPFQNEIRRLRNLGFIERVGGGNFSLNDLPDASPDLKFYVTVTDRGRKYLQLLESLKNQSPPTNKEL
ncbi:hypothetical protein [Floridanema evergladense]|uniref:LAGLIDADG homing endonuclease n=1 Tax=Floridaenema evergladense BLCC-F167 TaxID=3153639 RepID=A0ABV4WMY6_9CYAN